MLTGQAAPTPASPLYTHSPMPGVTVPVPYPDNPNGSTGNIAGICNARGNVFGLMPHPERYVLSIQHPQKRGNQGIGDGLLIFKNAFDYVSAMLEVEDNGRSTRWSPPQPNPPPPRPSHYAASGRGSAAADADEESTPEPAPAAHRPHAPGAARSAAAG